MAAQADNRIAKSTRLYIVGTREDDAMTCLCPVHRVARGEDMPTSLDGVDVAEAAEHALAVLHTLVPSCVTACRLGEHDEARRRALRVLEVCTVFFGAALQEAAI